MWRELEARHGPHTVDRYASAANALLPVFNTAQPAAGSAGAGALSQRWESENSFEFLPPTELPRVAQLLAEHRCAAATVVTPYWPAQAWFQQLSELAPAVEIRSVAATASQPPELSGSARHALSGAMLAFFRVPVRPA